MCVFIPIGSMYAIYGDIYHQYTPNVSIYTIHGSYGICWIPLISIVNHWYKCFDILNMPWRRPRVRGIASLGAVAFVAPPRGTAAHRGAGATSAAKGNGGEGHRGDWDTHILYVYIYNYIYIYILIFVLCHNCNSLQYVDILTTSWSFFIMFI